MASNDLLVDVGMQMKLDEETARAAVNRMAVLLNQGMNAAGKAITLPETMKIALELQKFQQKIIRENLALAARLEKEEADRQFRAWVQLERDNQQRRKDYQKELLKEEKKGWLEKNIGRYGGEDTKKATPIGAAIIATGIILAAALTRAVEESKILSTVVGHIFKALGLLIDLVLMPYLPLILGAIMLLYEGIMHLADLMDPLSGGGGPSGKGLAGAGEAVDFFGFELTPGGILKAASMIVGAIIGGILGYFLGGNYGALIGAAIGSLLVGGIMEWAYRAGEAFSKWGADTDMAIIGWWSGVMWDFNKGIEDIGLALNNIVKWFDGLLGGISKLFETFVYNLRVAVTSAINELIKAASIIPGVSTFLKPIGMPSAPMSGAESLKLSGGTNVNLPKPFISSSAPPQATQAPPITVNVTGAVYSPESLAQTLLGNFNKFVLPFIFGGA